MPMAGQSGILQHKPVERYVYVPPKSIPTLVSQGFRCYMHTDEDAIPSHVWVETIYKVVPRELEKPSIVLHGMAYDAYWSAENECTTQLVPDFESTVMLILQVLGPGEVEMLDLNTQPEVSGSVLIYDEEDHPPVVDDEGRVVVGQFRIMP